MQSLIRTRIGRYRITRLLGIGGMGEVYHAEDERIGRAVAIKVLRQMSREPDRLERFYNEARIHSRLYHPNIAAMLEICEMPQGPCIVMEHVAGVTLADWIERNGAMPWREAARLFHEIVRAVGYLHANGVVHRDITMSNIKLTPENRIKLLDFGLARDTHSLALTQIGTVAGTTFYLSPEQITGGAADARSDVWSLGVLFHAMLIGRPPFQANDTMELWNQLKSHGYAGLRAFNPGMPEWCDALISRCLRLRPARRFQNAGEIASHLDGMLTPAKRQEAAFQPRIRVALRLLSARARGSWRILLPACGAPMVLALYFSAAAPGSGKGERPATVPQANAWPRFDRVPGFATTPESIPSLTEASVNEAPLAEVRIGSSGGSLEVYAQGRLLGVAAARPLTFTAEIGTTLSLLLRRGGERDQHVFLTVAQMGNDYAY